MAEQATSKPDLTQALNNLETALEDFRNAVRSSGIPKATGGPIFTALRQWRSEQARAKQLPPYIIATDAVLRAIEDARPADIAQLKAVRGVSANKADAYGEGILQVVASAK